MNKKAQTATPRLRFPEFRKAPAWKWKTLSHACEMQAGKFISASEIAEKPIEGAYPCYGGNGLRGYTTTFTHSGKYPLIGRQGALCGNIQFAEGEFYATEHALVSTPKSEINVEWLYYTLDGLRLNRFATGQAQPGLSVDVLNGVACAVPAIEGEQQKIADCLTSLDDVIAAQARKVEALKEHKRGLMQQLFPREGETVPRLRFPEFRKGIPWTEKRLKEICIINPSSGDLPDSFIYIDLESVDGGVLYAKHHIEKKEAPSRAQRLLRDGDVIFQMVRPYQRNNLFIQLDDTESYVASTGYAQLRANKSKRFLYQLVHTEHFVNAVLQKCTGSSYPAINSSDLADLVIFAPKDTHEQQKIADCLTSLDDVIAAQARKVEALKEHKQGLMQQLFPAPEAMGA